jgi:hypothetical protein
MSRSWISLRNWRPLLAILVAAVFILATAGDADARRKKRKKKAKKKAVPTVNEKALSALRGKFEFGMSKDEVLKILRKQINERYDEEIQNTNDVYMQDKLRRKKKRELNRVNKSYVEFTGKKTGWDVSIVDDQFKHGTEEAMMVYWENYQGKNQRRFFFFFQGRLYKMFIALNTEAMGGTGKNFAYYQGILERRFGAGLVGFRTDKEGIEWPNHIDWKSKKYRVRALDKLSFYGSFCLWVADPGVMAQVNQLREERAPAAKEDNRVIKAITADGAEDPELGEGAGTIDSILKD